MLYIAQNEGDLQLAASCDICGGPISHHSEGVAVYVKAGGKAAMHHNACRDDQEQSYTTAIPLTQAIGQLVQSLGVESAPRKRARVRASV